MPTCNLGYKVFPLNDKSITTNDKINRVHWNEDITLCFFTTTLAKSCNNSGKQHLEVIVFLFSSPVAQT